MKRSACTVSGEAGIEIVEGVDTVVVATEQNPKSELHCQRKQAGLRDHRIEDAPATCIFTMASHEGALTGRPLQ